MHIIFSHDISWWKTGVVGLLCSENSLMIGLAVSVLVTSVMDIRNCCIVV